MTRQHSIFVSAKSTMAFCIFSIVLNVCIVSIGHSQTAKEKLSVSEQLAIAAKKATVQKYLLRYKFEEGDVVYWQTEQVDNGEVSLQKKKELTRSRTLSTKKWRITGIDKNGNISAVQSLADVDMWQQIDQLPPTSYNSRTDSKPPIKFENIADTIGIELVNFKFEPNGNLLEKKANYSDVELGMGRIVVEFPTEAIAVGHKWYHNRVIKAALPTGQIKKIRIRRMFQLVDVKHQVAKIGVQTQILTPIHDPEIEVQIMDQLTQGFIRFDIQKGRILSREYHWNRTVQGFSTADSLKRYVGRFKQTPKSKDAVELAAKAAIPDTVNIRLINDGPILRQ